MSTAPDADASRTAPASWLLQWRNLTPGGKPTKVEYKANLSTEDVAERLAKILGTSCWIFLQREDIKFPGSSVKR